MNGSGFRQLMSIMINKLITIVCPFYNEEESVDSFFIKLIKTLGSFDDINFEIICIDDGSKDKTLSKLLSWVDSSSNVRVIELSRNFGKEAALSAGIDAAIGEALIPIDADLQDPPELILQMLNLWRDGAEIVLARRVDRSSESFFKRVSAMAFYKLINRLSDASIPENVGDFRLIDRVAIDAIKTLPENQRFMKGLFAWIGFKIAYVDYVRPKRAYGSTKFSPWKLWNFALDGITSFSTFPLRLWSYIGFFISLISIIYGLYIVYLKLFSGINVPGYASILVAILFLGGVQLIGMGVLGEYIGRSYFEAKRRPVYIVRKRYGDL